LIKRTIEACQNIIRISKKRLGTNTPDLRPSTPEQNSKNLPARSRGLHKKAASEIPIKAIPTNNSPDVQNLMPNGKKELLLNKSTFSKAISEIAPLNDHFKPGNILKKHSSLGKFNKSNKNKIVN
jgi:hypothetical protein